MKNNIKALEPRHEQSTWTKTWTLVLYYFII